MESVYERYGDHVFWDRIMDQFYEKNLSDPDLKDFYIGKDMQRIKRMNQELLATALRSSASHFLVSVKRTHRTMEIFGLHFGKFVSNLGLTLAENNVSKSDIQEIVDVIETFRADLVKD